MGFSSICCNIHLFFFFINLDILFLLLGIAKCFSILFIFSWLIDPLYCPFSLCFIYFFYFFLLIWGLLCFHFSKIMRHIVRSFEIALFCVGIHSYILSSWNDLLYSTDSGIMSLPLTLILGIFNITSQFLQWLTIHLQVYCSIWMWLCNFFSFSSCRFEVSFCYELIRWKKLVFSF